MVEYTCEQCRHIFSQKQHLQKHLNRQKKCPRFNEKIKHNKAGQYFTTNEYLKQCVFKLIENNSSVILEPSMGQGDLVNYVMMRNPTVSFDLYEIDDSIEMLDSIDNTQINYKDFLTAELNTSYDTIIGNPPYVKTKGGNLYLDFIKKCYNLLNVNGELIFIVPSDFIKLTSSGKIINTMMGNGTFTHIIHPNNDSLFADASIDVIVFRYCKNKRLPKKIIINYKEKYLVNTNGILTFSDTTQKDLSKFSEYFDIHVGMVTGKESVFKNNLYGNIELLNGIGKIDKYILMEKFPSENPDLNEYMLSFKSELKSRRIKKFTEKNWFEWGALRNYETVKNNIGKDCIYISNITRMTRVCFRGKVQYFGGGLIIMIPTQSIDIKKVVDYMNSETFKNNYMYSGRFKIGHKQLCNCLFKVSEFL